MQPSIRISARARSRCVRITLVLAAFSCLALAALPASAACDPERARDRLAWADDLRDYIELWHDIGNQGSAIEDLEVLGTVLTEAAAALERCPQTPTTAALRLEVGRMSAWAERAGRALNMDD
jgi:hypothetical protein